MPVTRRDWLASAAGATAAAAIGMDGLAPDLYAGGPPADRKRVLRLAHLTDLHVQPERAAEQGIIACLHHAQSLADAPQLILTGGDSVMDVMGTDAARARIQAGIWRRVLKNECSLPIRSCIGNHDVWGCNRQDSKTTGDEPNWGKAWGEDLLGLSHRYYHFDHAG